MSVSKFFEKMIGLQKQRSQQKQNSYRELVAAIATGKEPNLAEVERLLSEFGMSLDDLKQDVEVYQTRMALKALVATLPKIDQETTLVQQKIAAADRELEAAEQRYEDTTAPLYGRLREINEVRKEISQARQELFNTCDSPELDEEYEQVESQMEALAKVNQELESQAAYVEGRANASRVVATVDLGSLTNWLNRSEPSGLGSPTARINASSLIASAKFSNAFFPNVLQRWNRCLHWLHRKKIFLHVCSGLSPAKGDSETATAPCDRDRLLAISIR